MEYILFGKKEKYIGEILIVNLTILLFLFRTAFPFLKYPFLIFYCGDILYFTVFYKRLIITEFKQFFKNFFLIFLLFIILIISFLLSDKIYLTVFKDIINVFVMLSLFFMLNLAINTKKELDFFVNNLIDLIILFGFGISLIGIADLFTIISIRDSDIIDYNFALLPVLFCIIGIIYKLSTNVPIIFRVLYSILLIISTLQVFLSGSRRGLIVLLAIGLILVTIQMCAFISRKSGGRILNYRFRSATILFMISLILIPAFCYLILFHSSFMFKENALHFLGSKNESQTKYNLTTKLNRYTSILLGSKNDFQKHYRNIWSPDLDSKDPNSGWGSGIHKTIFPLSGANVGIVPEGTKGYLIDSTCEARVIDGKAYSTTLLENFNVDKGDIVEASVFCYVTKDFNGSSVNIAAEGSAIGNVEVEYNTHKSEKYPRGESVNLIHNGDFQRDTLFWEIYGAYSTRHQIIGTPFGKGIRVTRTVGDGDWSLQYAGRPIIYYAGHEYKFQFYYKVIQGGSIPFKIGWWINDAGQGYTPTVDLPLKIKDMQDGWKEASCSYRFKETHNFTNTFLNSFIRNSVVDFADIKLFDLDSNESAPAFVDEVIAGWQELKIQSVCNEGRVKVSLNFTKDSVKDFKSLKGHVIFAYPQCKVIRYKSATTVSYFAQDYCTPNLDKLTKSTVEYFFGQVATINRDRESDKLTLDNRTDYIYSKLEKDDSKLQILKYSGFSNYSCITFLSLAVPFDNMIYSDSLEHDKIRNLAARIISEDTTYHGYKAILSVDSISDSFQSIRLRRWQFALQIYTKEFNWLKRLFGGGFNFLNWYSFYFEGDPTKSDYPHNPLLSILLYSGIIGLLFYFLLLFRTIKYYYIYFKEYSILSIYFVIAYFFSFFSGGSPFDPPLMGFFIIFPHLIRSIFRKTLNS